MAKNQARPVNQLQSASVSSKADNNGYLINAEMAVECNYSMVGDGVINNIPKPSMLERLEELEQRKKERHKNDFFDDKRERHKADYLDSKNER